VFEIREAVVDDAEAIVQLTAAGWRAAYPGIVSKGRIENLPIAGWRHDVGSGLRSPVDDSFTWIAEAEGEAAGYCFVAAPGREEPADSTVAEVVALYVDPDRWRQGIGQALLGRAEEEAGFRGYTEGILWSFERNIQAVAFYERMGWSRDGAARPHAGTGAPTVRLGRPLG
jgi:GNAT superfamily N-acetyltransferase